MRKALTLSIIATILGFTAYFSKPSEDACIKKAKEEFSHKFSSAVNAMPTKVDETLFAQTLEKNFLKSLEVKDKFLYRDIYKNAGGVKNKIGWAAFSWVNVEIK